MPSGSGARFVLPHEGEARWVGGEHIMFKVRSSETAQAMSVIEDTVEPGYGPPPHIHRDEHEIFYVVEGEFTFSLGGDAMSAPPGTIVTVPKGQLHTFQNVGASQGRLLAIVWPSVAFEKFVEEAGTVDAPVGPPDVDRILRAVERHGIVVPPMPGSS